MEKRILLSLVVLLAVTNVASAIVVQGIDMDFVPIGNAGNGTDPVTGDLYGAVAYDYSIGKYEVTNAQWNAFVSALGAPTGNPSDGYDDSAYWTAQNVPANNVSWYEVAQFCNYLTSGDKSLGAYLFSGNNTNPGDFLGIDRNWAVSAYGIAYVIPTEDEWYKAAYYTGSGYSKFANGFDTMTAPGNGWNYGSYPGGFPWDVGTGTMEQNGTFDMMGNIFEWTEIPSGGSYSSVGGGAYNVGPVNFFPLPTLGLGAGQWLNTKLYHEYDNVGFRVASVSVYVPVPTIPPIADAGPNTIAYTDINGIATVSFDGTGSYDEDSDDLTYLWTWSVDGNDYDVNGPTPTIELPVGEHTIELIVNDGIEDSEPDAVSIIVIDPLKVRTYYVDDDGSADFNNIQAAVDAAYYGDTVLVADGIYTGEGNRDIDFLGKAITVKSENGPENCIIDCNATWNEQHCGFDFISNQDTNSVIDGFTITNGYTSDRSGGIYCRNSALTISNCNIRGNMVWGGRGGGYGGGISVIDGIYLINNCTISNNSGEHDGSGGISCENSALTISNSTVTDNFSERRRGGIFCSDDSDVAITNCTISGNSGYWEGGGIECYQSCMIIKDCNISGNRAEESWWYSQGGGIKCYDSNSTIINCIISGNTAGDGGGIYCKDSTSTISNCKISGNIICQDTTLDQCGGYGGGIYCDGSSSTIKNCIISGNTCGDEGGGICFKNSLSIISNCTFVGNSSYNGNSIACISSWQAQYPSSVEVSNCILWDGGDEIWNNDGSTINITYSDIQGGWEGEGNIDTDPCFDEPGFWDANGTPEDAEDDFWVEGDYHLRPSSVCIDAGDPCYVAEPNETDIDGNPRVINSRIDMGAYEFIPPIEVSMKLTPRRIIRHSRNKLIMAWLRLPEDITKDQIDSNEPLLLYPGGIEAELQHVFGHGKKGDKGVRIFAFFDKSELTEAVSDNGQVQLEVVGYLTTSQEFYGTDFVTILDRRQPRKR